MATLLKRNRNFCCGLLKESKGEQNSESGLEILTKLGNSGQITLLLIHYLWKQQLITATCLLQQQEKPQCFVPWAPLGWAKLFTSDLTGLTTHPDITAPWGFQSLPPQGPHLLFPVYLGLSPFSDALPVPLTRSFSASVCSFRALLAIRWYLVYLLPAWTGTPSWMEVNLVPYSPWLREQYLVL